MRWLEASFTIDFIPRRFLQDEKAIATPKQFEEETIRKVQPKNTFWTIELANRGSVIYVHSHRIPLLFEFDD